MKTKSLFLSGLEAINRSIPVLVLGTVILLTLFSGYARSQTLEELVKQADSLYFAGNYDSAFILGRQIMLQFDAENARKDTSTANIYHTLGRCYGVKSEFESADSLTRIALELKRELLPPAHPSILKSMYNIGLFNENNGNYDEAEAMYLEAIDLVEEVMPSVYSVLVELHWRLSIMYVNLSRWNDAFDILHKVQPIIVENEGIYCERYVSILGKIATDYQTYSLFDKALIYADSCLEIAESGIEINDAAYAQALQNVSWVYFNFDRYEEAESLSKRAIAINELLYGPVSVKVRENLHNLSMIYKGQARYAEAERMYLKTLDLYEKLEKPNSEYLANHCYNMSNFYISIDRLDDAEKYIRRALNIWEGTQGPTGNDYAAGLRVLGSIYTAEGFFARAEPIYLQAMNVMRDLFGDRDRQIAYIDMQLGNMYTKMGMYDKAETYFTEALSIFEECSFDRHIAWALNRVGMILTRRGYAEKGEPYYQRSLNIRKELFGVEHPDYVYSLKGLGWNYTFLGKYVEARDILNEALQVRYEFSDSTSLTGSILWDLADINRRLGDIEVADSLYNMAYGIYENIYGRKHEYCSGILEEKSKCLRVKGLYQEALMNSHTAYVNRTDDLRNNIVILSERDALNYAKQIRQASDTYLSAWIDGGKVSTADAADVVLLSKGLVFDEISNRNRALLFEDNEEVQAKLKSLKNTKLLLSHYAVSGPEKLDHDRYRFLLDSLQVSADRQETELARISSTFEKQMKLNDIDARQITDNLPHDCILVEYLKYNYCQAGSDETQSRYIASILRPGQDVEVVDLGPASAIEPVVGQYRRHMLEVSSADRLPTVIDAGNYRKIGEDLYGIIWKPIEKHITDGNLVLIAADGSLNMVSFAGLIDADGRYLVENHALHYLSSGRDIIRFKDEVEPASGLFAVGAPDYNATVLDRLSSPIESPRDSSSEPEYFALRNIRSGCGELNDITVNALPFTRDEVEAVAAAWRASSDEEMTVYFDSDASEENFKAEAPGNRVIHIATHGYFLQGDCQRHLLQGGRDDDFGFIGENPLLLSGLLFAGANLHGQGADSAGAEDGILTAYEVSAMDLTGSDLVILSACETGLGEVKEGEGVYGLRRAFQMAGVRRVISALWSVSDEVTAEMMSQLYNRQDASLPETLRNIQLDRINKLHEQGEVAHPFIWGAFIATGDWR